MIKPQKSFTIRTWFIIMNGALFIFAGTIFVIVVNYNMRGHTLWEAEEKARLILDRNLAI